MKKIYFIFFVVLLITGCSNKETGINDVESDVSNQEFESKELELEVDSQEIDENYQTENEVASPEVTNEKAYEADRIKKDALREEKKIIDAEIQKDPSVEQPKYITTIQTLYQEDVGEGIRKEVAEIWPDDPNKQSEMYTEYLMDYFELNDLEVTFTDQYYIMEEAFEIHGFNFEMVKFSFENGMDEYFGM